MKALRLGGAVIVAILLATAAFGTQSAAPTALCTLIPTEEDQCTAPIGEGTSIEAKAAKATIVTGAGSVICSPSLMSMKTTSGPAAKGKAVTAGEVSLSFSGCLLGKTECTATQANAPYHAQFQWATEANGEVSFENGGAGPPNLSIACGATISCTYTFESSLDVTGSAVSPAITASNDSAGSGSGKTCPTTTFSWSAVYTIIKPKEFFVADYAPTTQLCKKNETPCSPGEAYPSAVSFAAGLEAGTKAKLRLFITEGGEEAEYVVPCESSSLAGTVENGPLAMIGKMTSLSFGECGPTCSVKALKIPYTAKVEATGSGNGNILLSEGAGGGPPRIRVLCIGAYKCTYESPSLSHSISGGSPAKLQFFVTFETKVLAESDEKCGTHLKSEINYVFTQPEASGTAKMWIVREGI